LPKEVVEAAFNLANVGDLSPAVKTPRGVAVVKLLARKKAVVRRFDEVKPQIRNMLYRDQQQDRKASLEKQLREKINVRIDESKLSTVRVEGAVEIAPAALPPGNSTPIGG